MRTKTTALSLPAAAALLAAIYGASALPGPRAFASLGAPPVVNEIVLGHGDIIRGTIQARFVRVAEHATVYVDADATLHATEHLVVAGTLRAVDRLAGDPARDAPVLLLQSDSRLTVTGSIVGGRGRCFAGLDPVENVGAAGGHGSSVSLVAPDLLVAGTVHAGAGGQGGGGPGGDGGSLLIVGSAETSHGLADEVLDGLGLTTGFWSGMGGRGGDGVQVVLEGVSYFDGGLSGGSGNIHFEDHPEPMDPISQLD